MANREKGYSRYAETLKSVRTSGGESAEPRLWPARDFVGGEVIAVDKPLGWTSFDAVKCLRGALQRRLKIRKFKVGHAGTLDPLATGVLLICTGRATRRIDALQAGEKEYVATLKLGATTSSFDLETEIDATFPTAHIDRQLIDSTLPKFKGHIMQVPPVYSAVKVDGKRAYAYARSGEEVKIAAKALLISEIETLDFHDDLLTIRVVCSKGTYIRALARDIGVSLGSGAHLVALRRTRVGDYAEKDILTMEDALDMIASSDIVESEGSGDRLVISNHKSSRDDDMQVKSL